MQAIVLGPATHDHRDRIDQQPGADGEGAPPGSPAEFVDEARHQRGHHHPGERDAHRRHAHDATALLDEPFRDRDVDDEAPHHRRADDEEGAPQHDPLPQLGDFARQEEADAENRHADHHQRPAAEAVHVDADQQTDEGHHEAADALRDGELAAGPVQLFGHRLQEDAGDLRLRPDGDELGDERGADDPVAVVDQRPACRRRGSGGHRNPRAGERPRL